MKKQLILSLLLTSSVTNITAQTDLPPLHEVFKKLENEAPLVAEKLKIKTPKFYAYARNRTSLHAGRSEKVGSSLSAVLCSGLVAGLASLISMNAARDTFSKNTRQMWARQLTGAPSTHKYDDINITTQTIWVVAHTLLGTLSGAIGYSRAQKGSRLAISSSPITQSMLLQLIPHILYAAAHQHGVDQSASKTEKGRDVAMCTWNVANATLKTVWGGNDPTEKAAAEVLKPRSPLTLIKRAWNKKEFNSKEFGRIASVVGMLIVYARTMFFGASSLQKRLNTEHNEARLIVLEGLALDSSIPPDAALRQLNAHFEK